MPNRLILHVLFVFLLLHATPAFAYIGFGPGLTMVGSFFSLVATVAVLLAMVIFFPLRMLIKRYKSHKNNTDNEPPTS